MGLDGSEGAVAGVPALPPQAASPPLPPTPRPAPRAQARMLPTLCDIVSHPAQHPPLLVDGALELIAIVLAPLELFS